jgi:hypothetical protein
MDKRALLVLHPYRAGRASACSGPGTIVQVVGTVGTYLDVCRPFLLSDCVVRFNLPVGKFGLLDPLLSPSQFGFFSTRSFIFHFRLFVNDCISSSAKSVPAACRLEEQTDEPLHEKEVRFSRKTFPSTYLVAAETF